MDKDIHAITAKAVLQLEKLPEKGTFERDYVGKGINLIMRDEPSPKEFADELRRLTKNQVSLTEEEAERYINSFYSAFPNFKSVNRCIELLWKNMAFTNN